MTSSGALQAVGPEASSSGQGISEPQGGIDPHNANLNDKVDSLAAAISADAEPLASEGSPNNPTATPASFKINTSLPAEFSGFPQTSAAPTSGFTTAFSAQITIDGSASRMASLASDSQPAIVVANLAKAAPAFSKVSAVDAAGSAAAKSLGARPLPLSLQALPPQPLSSAFGELAKTDATLQTQPARTLARIPVDAATAPPDTTVSGGSSNMLPVSLPFPDHAAAPTLTTVNAKLSATETQTGIVLGATPVAAATTNSSNSAQNSASRHSFSGSSDEPASSAATSSKSSTTTAFAPALEGASRSDAGATPQNFAGTAIASATAGATPITAPPVSAHVASPNADTISSASLSRDPVATDPSANALPSPATDATAPNRLISASQLGGAGGAQLAQNGGRSEIHVALQTDNLGTIELHARVSGDSVGAAITVEKRDAHTALAADLPVLQQALSDKQLRVEQISLVHAPLHATAGHAAAQHFGGQEQPGGRQSSSFSQLAASAENGDLVALNGFVSDAAEIFDAQGRLSVHA